MMLKHIQDTLVSHVRLLKLTTACDGDTKSEIVLPLRLQTPDGPKVVGVLDLDSTLLSTFDEDDLRGLEGVVKIIAATLDWP